MLSALLFEGHAVSYCCLIGMCGMCKVDVEQGQIRPEEEEEEFEGLSATDRQQGRILMCRSVATSDCVVRMVHGNTAAPTTGVPAIVMGVESLDERWTWCRLKVIEPAPAYTLHPAQQVLLEWCPDSGTSCLARAYLGSPSDTSELDFYLDRHAQPEQAPLCSLRPGTVIHFGAASGTTPSGLGDGTPILLIAEGPGVIPVASILRACAQQEKPSSIRPHRIVGVSQTLEDHILQRTPEWFASIPMHENIESLTAALLENVQRCLNDGLPLRDIRAYVYASQDTNAAVRKQLLDTGMKPWKINVESIR